MRPSRSWWQRPAAEAPRDDACEDVAQGSDGGPGAWPLEEARGGAVDVQVLIDALDQRILEAIAAKATGETIVRLCEARAWLTHPAQAHLTAAPSPA